MLGSVPGSAWFRKSACARECTICRIWAWFRAWFSLVPKRPAPGIFKMCSVPYLDEFGSGCASTWVFRNTHSGGTRLGPPLSSGGPNPGSSLNASAKPMCFDTLWRAMMHSEILENRKPRLVFKCSNQTHVFCHILRRTMMHSEMLENRKLRFA